VGFYGVSLPGFMTFMVNIVAVSAAAITALGVIAVVTYRPQRIRDWLRKAAGVDE